MTTRVQKCTNSRQRDPNDGAAGGRAWPVACWLAPSAYVAGIVGSGLTAGRALLWRARV
jgi:hypothetical protein